MHWQQLLVVHSVHGIVDICERPNYIDKLNEFVAVELDRLDAHFRRVVVQVLAADVPFFSIIHVGRLIPRHVNVAQTVLMYVLAEVFKSVVVYVLTVGSAPVSFVASWRIE